MFIRVHPRLAGLFALDSVQAARLRMGARTAEELTARVRTGCAEQRVWIADCYHFCIFVASRLESTFMCVRPARKANGEATHTDDFRNLRNHQDI